jgi:hypothetical protein
MNAQRIPIVEPAIQRPTYDNTFLGYEADWIEANIVDLLSWWDTCGQHDGMTDPKEFPSFARSQHDLELTRREDYRNTLRQY